MLKRKIIITVGPSSFSENIIRKMDDAGVDIFRINLSHTAPDEIEERILKLQQWTSKTVCIDTEGAQLRTGRLLQNTVQVASGQLVKLVSKDIAPMDESQIPLSVKEPWMILQPGDLLKIDFHAVIVQVIEAVPGEHVVCRVIQPGKVGTNKGISVDRDIKLPPFSEKDLKAFDIGRRRGITCIAFSFAASGEDVRSLRTLFDEKIQVISKIESIPGLRNIQSICEASDAVLVDRGDLSRDVPLEKIISAQAYVQDWAKLYFKPVYVATNLMENMIENSKPTRAEIHDIIGTLQTGTDGLVLAAETAIGKHPVECVRIMARLINEFDNKDVRRDIQYLTSLPADRIIEPHGGTLVQQHLTDFDMSQIESMAAVEVDDRVLSDMVQIAEGTYSPLTGFMNLAELESVLDSCKLPSGISWTLPVLFQVSAATARQLPHSGPVAVKRREDGVCYAVLHIHSVQELNKKEKIALQWFGTSDPAHYGVLTFYQNGEYIIAGKPYLIKKPILSPASAYELVPRQTRDIFNDYGWHHVVGFHTRNVIHRGHEYIQLRALEEARADALLISPVIGKKKPGDFSAQAIIASYQTMIRHGFYRQYGVLLGTFNTYSRYSGPREAVFTALCRKNFGCSHFIIGRDHTGVGNYYSPDASRKLFDKIDIGMHILTFDTAYYCTTCQTVTTACAHEKPARMALSGTTVRSCLLEGTPVPKHLMRPEVAQELQQLYAESSLQVFENDA